MLIHVVRGSDFCMILGWKLPTHAINAPEWHSAVLHASRRPLQLIMQLSVLYLKPCGPQELPLYASWLYEYYQSGDSNISLTWKTFWKRYENNAVYYLENLKVSNGKLRLKWSKSQVCHGNIGWILTQICQCWRFLTVTLISHWILLCPAVRVAYEGHKQMIY
jgi:hypothetical protein